MAYIGLLADTHVPHRMTALPAVLFEQLAGVDLVLHAGDLDDPAVLDELCHIAPVQAVRGNLHLQAPWPNDQRLPLFRELQIEGQRIVLTHGHLSFWNSLWEKFWMVRPDHRMYANRRMMARMARVFPGADVYVFGHSHRASIERRGAALFVNPGAVCATRGEISSMARLRVMPDGVEAEIVPL